MFQNYDERGAHALKAFNKIVGSEVVVDTGIVIEYLNGSEIGKKIYDLIFTNEFIISILATPILAIEVYYLLRRKSSKEFVIETMKKLQSIITFIPLNDYITFCGEIKAKHPFALADCCTLGLAEYKDIKALFIHEKEIDEQLQKTGSNQYTQRIVFIDDFQLFEEKNPNSGLLSL